MKSAPALAATAHLKATQAGFDAFLATLTDASAASYRGPGGADRFTDVRSETPVDSRVVLLADGPNGTKVATVQAKRRDGVIIEFFLTLREEGSAWKVER